MTSSRWMPAAVASGMLLAAAGPPGALAAESDLDGDGSVAPADCRPLDPAVHPGAVDVPDLAFEDADCDGIDGDAVRSVFVAPAGSDSATGTPLNPVQSIQQGLVLAARSNPPKAVLVAGGDCAGPVALRTGVDVYGAHTPITWARSRR